MDIPALLSEIHRKNRTMDIPTLVDCGCIAYVWEDGSGVEIEFCSLHRYAQGLVDGAKLALAELDRIGGDYGFEPERFSERIKATCELNFAVRMAERDKNAK